VDLAYEACVLDVLRCGVRCMQLRSPKHGTRIVGCTMLLRIGRGDVPRWMVGDPMALRALVDSQQARLLEQAAAIEELNATVSELRAQLAAGADE
jgi:hypothetical protein